MSKVEITRLFTKINYEGCITPPAIISFGRACIEWRNEDMGNGMGRTVVSKYRYDLKINLWLITFYFSWKLKTPLLRSTTITREH
jgi:hypothetical protein